MILTISIPTYNRPDKVKRTVSMLLPQLNEKVKVVILDNCSEVDVKGYLQEHIDEENLKKVEVIRHRVNIGADSNFQRCFELCTTPYIWMLGDDDKVEDNAVKLILEEIENFKDVDLIGINFKSNCCWVPRDSTITISSTNELANKLDTFGNWLFISTSVYKTKEYLKYIHFQSWGAYSMASQLVPPMIAISNNKTFVLSDKYIVTNVPVEDKSKKWSDFQLALGLVSLLEAPIGFKNDEYKAFGDKLSIHFNCIYPGDALFTILKSVNYNIDIIDAYHIYIYKQIIMKTNEFRKSRRAKQLLQYYICLFLLKNKSVLKTLFKLVPRIRTQSEKQVPFKLFVR